MVKNDLWYLAILNTLKPKYDKTVHIVEIAISSCYHSWCYFTCLFFTPALLSHITLPLHLINHMIEVTTPVSWYSQIYPSIHKITLPWRLLYKNLRINNSLFYPFTMKKISVICTNVHNRARYICLPIAGTTHKHWDRHFHDNMQTFKQSNCAVFILYFPLFWKNGEKKME